jgi:hypothetical protein
MAEEFASGSNLVESSKQLAAENRKLEKAEKEVKQLQQRQKSLEEIQARDKQRLQLLLQQTNSLKKQMQSKEELPTEWRVKAEEAQAAAARLDMQLQAHTDKRSDRCRPYSRPSRWLSSSYRHRHRHRLVGQTNSSGSFKETTNDFKQSWPGSNLLRVRRLLLLLLLFSETAANAFADLKAMNSAVK